MAASACEALASWPAALLDDEGAIAVHVRSACHLRKSIVLRSPDPFVRIAAAGGLTQQTPAVRRRKNPVWNEQVLRFPGTLRDLLQTPLRVEVCNARRRDAPLGLLQLDLAKILTTDNLSYVAVDMPLPARRRSRLQLGICWEPKPEELWNLAKLEAEYEESTPAVSTDPRFLSDRKQKQRPAAVRESMMVRATVVCRQGARAIWRCMHVDAPLHAHVDWHYVEAHI